METQKSIGGKIMKLPGFSEKVAGLIGNIDPSELARVIIEHKERYIVQTETGVYQAEITGNIRFSARSRADFPAVGDWVRITPMDAQNAIILEVFPRYSSLSRQAVGKQADIQFIASNIDVAFIVQSVGHDFNINRLERYLALCYAGKIEPMILLTKVDLISQTEIDSLTDLIRKRLPNVKMITISSENGTGYNILEETMQPNVTYCFVGSSGVGKSTIINHLSNEEKLQTAAISTSTQKGRHTTTHRELFVLDNGSIVIDTPGMRELGMTDESSGIDLTYDQITELSDSCRYSDCTHTSEKRCAVLDAVENGDLSEETYQNYLKLKREQQHFSSTIHEKRQKGKEFGKMIKAVLKEHKKNKY
ncbi:ribosome small subunit-dependent GTPase A [Maribellus sp. YY47]|uniref:ribosome small subunit-dependent GTPase A n=1 Tax=Maribellus sp. YY47 TaxID=2929486 RepID=UPI0020006E3C|nr:ribosome small subunit-dependent GTPase A [Maribellus sp. YY47]MCK3684782.1 ribosome small subunit-dependent GTPase A [Maribellus sp. YY47]